MTKKFSIFLTVLFCAFIGGVCVISLLLPDKDFSPLENRYLQKPPKLSLETLGSGKFMDVGIKLSSWNQSCLVSPNVS